MGKENNPRRVADNEAMAKASMLRISPQKLNLVAGLIRGKKASVVRRRQTIADIWGNEAIADWQQPQAVKKPKAKK